jgi:S-adenosylmethionine hydrolase
MALLTLTSDLGDQDYLVGAVKGCLYKNLPDLQQVDITHRLLPFNDAQAAYVVRTILQNYPAGTFHLVLANVFHRPPERMLLIRHQDQYIGIADNGLITMILEQTPEEAIALSMDPDRPHTILECVETLAKGIARLNAGTPLAEIGIPAPAISNRNPLRPLVFEDSMEGQILYVDPFENVVVNISKDEFEAQRRKRSFKIVFRRDEIIDRIANSYADVQEGEKLALFNAAGYLEIAINKGKAAGLFGLQLYDDQSQSQYSQSQLYYHTVKVYFE